MLYSINTKNPNNKVAKKYTKNLIKSSKKSTHVSVLQFNSQV